MHFPLTNLCCQRKAPPDEKNVSAPGSSGKVEEMRNEAFDELVLKSNLWRR